MSAQGEFAPGTVFGGYRIDQLIGRGGMGVVYRATQLALERPVALKAIQGHLAQDESFRHRFRREVMMAASIDHPNIIPVYEAGEIDGIPFLAMRYVPGTDLGLLIEQQGQLPLELIREVGEQIASALDAAHATGLVHRDVKPGNILVAHGGPGEVHSYLTDFGLTKGRGESHLTKTGTWVGTVSYIAPEQIEGRAIDGRADLYSFACVLYECVTGHPPFQRDSDVAMLYAHLQDERPHASAVRGDVPPALDALLVRGMARDPDERYQSGSALARALREALGKGSATLPFPVQAPPTTQATQVGGSTPPLSPPPPGADPDRTAAALAAAGGPHPGPLHATAGPVRPAGQRRREHAARPRPRRRQPHPAPDRRRHRRAGRRRDRRRRPGLGWRRWRRHQHRGADDEHRPDADRADDHDDADRAHGADVHRPDRPEHGPGAGRHRTTATPGRSSATRRAGRSTRRPARTRRRRRTSSTSPSAATG